MDLEAIAEISRLKYRYVRALDTKSWAEFTETLLPEVTATYAEHLRFDSRDAFVSFLQDTLGPHVITEHHCGHPEIEVNGDTATGIWYLSDTVVIPGDQMLMHGAAFYQDRYARDGAGRWRIAHTAYERTYESVYSLADVPSFRLTSNRWALIGSPPGMMP
ncbi:nuclear transport factor 2 family protein [Rhodococcus sp. ABRD24]|uniref:nuclear transport factor 2 family protein n=1 Tax=Rhodococcus sp. ABRD24 TaxID=2507582 RepID=UPI00103D8460|nr:nuclear transport factor 2 family protein [Rhodococcus sp. ABRD24]QBJ97597.1 nuclear transport factor 2 family protein [Rhodococcus sp. ABRD24]